MAQQEPRLELPSNGPYSDWGEWAALIIGAIDESLTDLDAWFDSSKPDVLTTLDEIRWILPQLSACVAALEDIALKFFVVAHKESQNTAGGTTTANAYFKHTLNEEIADADNLASLSGGDVTVQPGTWLLIGVPVIYKASTCHAAIYDVTGSARVATGLGDYADPTSSHSKQLFVLYPVVLASARAFRLEVWTANAQTGNGGGINQNITNERYAYLIGLKMA